MIALFDKPGYTRKYLIAWKDENCCFKKGWCFAMVMGIFQLNSVVDMHDIIYNTLKIWKHSEENAYNELEKEQKLLSINLRTYSCNPSVVPNIIQYLRTS